MFSTLVPAPMLTVPPPEVLNRAVPAAPGTGPEPEFQFDAVAQVPPEAPDHVCAWAALEQRVGHARTTRSAWSFFISTHYMLQPCFSVSSLPTQSVSFADWGEPPFSTPLKVLVSAFHQREPLARINLEWTSNPPTGKLEHRRTRRPIEATSSHASRKHPATVSASASACDGNAGKI